MNVASPSPREPRRSTAPETPERPERGGGEVAATVTRPPKRGEPETR